MTKLSKILLSLTAILFMVQPLAANDTKNPNHKTSALYSPGCNEKQLKTLAGDALIKISVKQNWANDTKGYIVTLDTVKLSYGSLTQKMASAKCFEKPKGKKVQ